MIYKTIFTVTKNTMRRTLILLSKFKISTEKILTTKNIYNVTNKKNIYNINSDANINELLKKCTFCADFNGICTKTKKSIVFERSEKGKCGINGSEFVRW